MVDMAHFAGLVAGKVLTGDYDPMPHAHIVTTTTHKTFAGRGEDSFCATRPRRVRGPRLPDGARRSPTARHGGQGRRPRRGVRCPFGPTRSHRGQRRVLAEGLLDARCHARHRRHGQPPRLLDVAEFGLTGRQAEAALLDGRRHVEPQRRSRRDPNGAWYTSGLRLGTPRGHHARAWAPTRWARSPTSWPRSFTPPHEALSHPAPTREAFACAVPPRRGTADAARSRVNDLLERHPLYPEIEL